MCQSLTWAHRPSLAVQLHVPTLAGTAAGAALGYTLAATNQQGTGLCLCSLASGAVIGAILPRLASEDEVTWIHWFLLSLATVLAAALFLGVAIHTFNPYMFALCPFCGRPLA
jgi:hypothetical protein